MDSPIRTGVTSLVRQVGSGEISRSEFFERLAELQIATPEPTVGLDAIWFDGTHTQSLTKATHEAITGLANGGEFSVDFCPDKGAYIPGIDESYFVDASDGLSVELGNSFMAYGGYAHNTDRIPMESSMETPPLLTSDQARALILGTTPWSSHLSTSLIEDTGGHAPIAPSPYIAWDIEPAVEETHPDGFVMAALASDTQKNAVHSARIASRHEQLTEFTSDSPGRHAFPLSPMLSPSRLHDGPQQIMSPDNSFNGSLRHSYSTGSFDPHFSAFAQRNEVWDMQRAQKCQELRLRRDAEESAKCSFRPNSSSSSGRRARINRPSSASDTSTNASSSKGLSCSAAAALARRLSRPITGKDRTWQNALKWREYRENEEVKECTFQPNIRASSKSHRLRVASSPNSTSTSMCDLACGSDTEKHMSSGGATSSSRRPKPRPFVPITNEVTEDMVNARAYLSEGVFSRLNSSSRNSVELQQQEGRTSKGMRRCASASGVLEKTSETSSGSCFDMGTSRSFLNFLQRQNECERIRREHLEGIYVETAPKLQPDLCDRSLLLAERRRFRKEKNVSDNYGSPGEDIGINGSADALLKTLHQDRECTFQPVITKMAKDLERSSISDEKRMECEKKQRDSKLAKTREELREKEMKDASFAPSVNNARNLPAELAAVPGRIRAHEDPDAYLNRVKQKRCNDEKIREREKNHNLKKEMAACTFKPQVRNAPEFVQRMAETYRLVRNLKEKENLSHDGCLEEPERPEWR